ncbi:MAG: PAS domain S-box protein, partial [Chloroflexi bacterium]|nr:PAS domain S-box protein [Chloroflexota bacterium]
MMKKQSRAPGASDGRDLAAALAPHRDTILGQLAQAWRMRAPKSTVMLGAPQRASEVAEAIGTAWFVWLENVNDLNTIREPAIDLVRQGVTYTMASNLVQLLAAIVTDIVAKDARHEVAALKLTRQFSAAFLDQIATQHELRTQQEQEHLAVQLQASAEVGRAAASILDTDQLLREVVNLITDRFGFYYTAVFTLDHTGQYALLREATGQAGEVLKNLNHKLDIQGKSMVGAAITSQRPRVAAEVSGEVLRFSNPLLPDTQSEIALPLSVGDRVLGALDVQSTEPHAFDETNVTVLQNMADQIAIAVENAQLFERTRQAVEASQATQQLLSALIDSIPAPVFFKDMRGAYLGCNRAYESYLGWTREVLAGKSVFDIAPHDLALKYQAEDQKLLDNPGVQIYEAAVVYADGSRHNVIFNKATFTDAHGQLAGLVGVIQDITERKQTEEALQRNETELSEALRIAQLGNWSYDVPTDTFTFNDQFYALMRTTAEREGGYTLSSAQYVQRFVHPDDAPMVGAEIGKALTATDPDFRGQIDHRIYYGDGEPGYITVRYYIEQDAQGRTIKTHGANQDITERKRAEEAMRRSEARLSDALRVARLAYWEYDVEKDLFQFNDQFFSIFRTTAAEHGGYQLSSGYYAQHFVHPDDLPVVGAEIERALTSTDRHYSRELEHRIRYADGQVGYISVSINIDRDETGKILRYYGSNQDITERRQIELDLAQERNLLRTLIDTLPERLFAKDTQSRFTLANAAEIRLDGASSFEELRGKNDFDFYPADLAQQYYDAERPIIEEGRSLVGYEERSADQEGNPRWHISTKVPLRDVDGNIVGLVGMTRDITQIKEVEAALVEERNRLRTLIDNLPDSVYIKDRTSRFVVNNLAHLRVLGAASQAEAVGKTDFDFFPPESAQQYFTDEQEVMRLGQPLLNREETVISAA